MNNEHTTTTDHESEQHTTEQTESTSPSEEAYVESAQNFESAPEGFESDIDMGSLTVPDHPVIVDVEGHGQASAKLVTWGVIEDIQQKSNRAKRNGDESSTIDSRTVARLLREHYVSPSFEGLTAEKVRQMHMNVPDKFLGAIMPGMDTQMNADGSAEISPAGADAGK